MGIHISCFLRLWLLALLAGAAMPVWGAEGGEAAGAGGSGKPEACADKPSSKEEAKEKDAESGGNACVKWWELNGKDDSADKGGEDGEKSLPENAKPTTATTEEKLPWDKENTRNLIAKTNPERAATLTDAELDGASKMMNEEFLKNPSDPKNIPESFDLKSASASGSAGEIPGASAPAVGGGQVNAAVTGQPTTGNAGWNAATPGSEMFSNKPITESAGNFAGQPTVPGNEMFSNQPTGGASSFSGGGATQAVGTANTADPWNNAAATSDYRDMGNIPSNMDSTQHVTSMYGGGAGDSLAAAPSSSGNVTQVAGFGNQVGSPAAATAQGGAVYDPFQDPTYWGSTEQTKEPASTSMGQAAQSLNQGLQPTVPNFDAPFADAPTASTGKPGDVQTVQLQDFKTDKNNMAGLTAVQEPAAVLKGAEERLAGGNTLPTLPDGPAAPAKDDKNDKIPPVTQFLPTGVPGRGNALGGMAGMGGFPGLGGSQQSGQQASGSGGGTSQQGLGQQAALTQKNTTLQCLTAARKAGTKAKDCLKDAETSANTDVKKSFTDGFSAGYSGASADPDRLEDVIYTEAYDSGRAKKAEDEAAAKKEADTAAEDASSTTP